MSEVTLQPAEQPRPTAMVSAQNTRAIAQVQMKMLAAKQFPREATVAVVKIRDACKNLAVAEKAFYSYRRGSTQITGPTVDLLEIIAQNWGNLQFGVDEISQDNGMSEVQAFAWDLETNVSETRTFVVPHKRYSTEKGLVDLTDPRDIYEMTANMGARRKRACLENVIPKYVVDAAVEECRKTLAGGGKKGSFAQRSAALVAQFQNELGVPTERIVEFIGHSLDEMSHDEFVALYATYQAIKSGEQKASDIFAVAKAAEPVSGADAIKKKFDPPRDDPSGVGDEPNPSDASSSTGGAPVEDAGEPFPLPRQMRNEEAERPWVFKIRKAFANAGKQHAAAFFDAVDGLTPMADMVFVAEDRQSVIRIASHWMGRQVTLADIWPEPGQQQ